MQRRLVVFLAACVALAVLALVAVEGQRTRARLDAELPRLRASIAALERDAAEVKRLRALPLPAATPGQGPAARSAPLAALATNGGGLQGAQVTALDDRRVKVSGSDVGFGALLEFLQNAQVTHGMRVESARLEALPTAGRVRAELLLSRS